LELALRAFGVGYDTRLVVQDEASASPTAFRFNPQADRTYYGLDDLSGPELRPFNIPKPEGVYRIVVVGGSSVAGFPYPFELAMPRQLELVLNLQMPERKFEVLNAGMTAIMSSSEVDVVRQALACQPDLIVIHTGHNEFYGPGGSASKLGALAPGLDSLSRFLKRQRSFQVFLSTLARPTKSHLIETLPADVQIPLDGLTYRRTEDRFRQNLKRMVEIAANASTPILLTTVPSNLRDMAPIEPPTSNRVAQRLREVERRMMYGEYEPAFAALTQTREANPNDSLVNYRMAQCLEGLGRWQEASQAYSLAADLDGCRFRAPSSFLNAVRDIAQASPRGVYFCDSAAKLHARSKLPAPGYDFFLEHVHFNMDGNWEMACILARSVVEDVLKAAWREERVPDDASRDELLEATPLDQLAAESTALVVLRAWPFDLSPARGAEIHALTEQVAGRYGALQPMERELFAGVSMDAMSQHLHLAMGDAWLAAGDPNRALAAYQRHIKRRPWEALGYLRSAAVLERQG
jgi:tetratricopeptide (TPR) repeat protein